MGTLETNLRVFDLVREVDETGMSGTGVVASGVVLPSGRVVMEWLTTINSIVIYNNIGDLEHIHSHGGKKGCAEIRWRA